MTLKEEVLELEKEVKEIQEESLAMSLLKDYKRQNKSEFKASFKGRSFVL